MGCLYSKILCKIYSVGANTPTHAPIGVKFGAHFTTIGATSSPCA